MAKKCIYCAGTGWKCGEDPVCNGGGGDEVTLGHICYKVVGGKRQNEYFADLIPVEVVAAPEEAEATAANLLKPDFTRYMRLPQEIEPLLSQLRVIFVKRVARDAQSQPRAT